MDEQGRPDGTPGAGAARPATGDRGRGPRRAVRTAAVGVTALLGALGLAGAAYASASPAPSVGSRPSPPRPVVGTVTSVDGATTPGSCGTAGAAGSFVLTPGGPVPVVSAPTPGPVTVDVTPSTTFTDPGVTGATFADVCVGETVAAVGHETSAGTLAATAVHVLASTPPPPGQRSVVGTVTSVDGATTPGSCGTAGAAGSFVLTPGGPVPVASAPTPGPVTVDVTPSTTFTDPDVTGATFADVCVGETVAATGSAVSTGTLAATAVHVLPAVTPPPPMALGQVLSVNGSSTTPSCGTAGTAGSFVLRESGPSPVANPVGTLITVDVTTATTFTDPGVTGATFANVCVGETVAAVGTESSGTLTATAVHVLPAVTPPPPPAMLGTVTSVNGSSTTPSCGTAGAAGSFVLNPLGPVPAASPVATPVTVDVTTATTFTDPGVTGATFANVCVGETVAAVGTESSGTLTATAVHVLPAVPVAPGRPVSPFLEPQGVASAA